MRGPQLGPTLMLYSAVISLILQLGALNEPPMMLRLPDTTTPADCCTLNKLIVNNFK